MKLFNLIWWLNIMVNFYILFKQRFAVNAISLLDSICLTYNNIILLIYFIYHLFKIHEIKTKIEFVMYLIIHLIVAVSLISYYHSLPRTRISEIFFLYLIFFYNEVFGQKAISKLFTIKRQVK